MRVVRQGAQERATGGEGILKKARPIKREDTARLRQCLEALSEACGHDVFRLQFSSSGPDCVLILTCSRQAKEQDVATLIASEFIRLSGVTEWKEKP